MDAAKHPTKRAKRLGPAVPLDIEVPPVTVDDKPRAVRMDGQK